MIPEAKISALAVSALAGVGLTIALSNVYRDIGLALATSVPVALVMGAVLFLFASDDVKSRGDKTPKDNPSKNKLAKGE